MKRIAILGATSAQKPLYIKAKKYGIYVVGISRGEDAICKDLCDVFYPISIAETERVIACCQKENVQGVVSNCSEFATRIVSIVAEKLSLDCTPYHVIQNIQDKAYTRNISNSILGFSKIKYYNYHENIKDIFPCVVKPATSSAKLGISFAKTKDDFYKAIEYAQNTKCESIVVEEYIEGSEVSVETISCRGQHYVIQITDKECSGPPHFVELSHHQPSSLDRRIILQIQELIPKLLNALHFVTGATHTELKIDTQGHIYLIEVNPRGGGDEISSKLVELSTGYDYIGSMIFAALGELEKPRIIGKNYAGIYFLTKQTENRMPIFINGSKYDWFVEGNIEGESLTECVTNRHKDGYLIYKSNHKITEDDII